MATQFLDLAGLSHYDSKIKAVSAGTNVARTSGDTPTWDPLGGSFSVTAVATADIDALFA